MTLASAPRFRRPAGIFHACPEVATSPDPRDFKLRDVFCVDLGQVRVGPHVAGVTTQVAPFTVFNS